MSCTPPETYCCCRKPIPEAEADTLAAIISHYRKHHLPGSFSAISNLKTVTDYICGKPNEGEAPLPKYRRDDHHQYCLPRKVIEEMAKRLKGIEADNFTHFDELREHVASLKTDHFGLLHIYDFCIRFGYSRGLLPDRRVYLHAGALEGAKALQKAELLKSRVRTPYVDIDIFPPELQELGSLHLEDFLCIEKEALKKLRDRILQQTTPANLNQANNKQIINNKN